MKKILLTALVLAGFSATAQVKVGSNPTTLATNAKFQVEGSTGAQTVILDNGNVGIGTTTPTYKLDVVTGTDAFQFLNGTGSNERLQGKVSSTGVNFNALNTSAAAIPITFSGAGTERFRIDNSGLIGIANNAPSFMLDVFSSTDNAFRFLNSTGSYERLQATVGSSGVNFNVLNTSGVAIPFTFSGAGTEFMRIHSNGRVGIGTTTPATKLDVFDSSFTPLRINSTSGTAVQFELQAIGGNNQGFDIGVTNSTHGWGSGFYIYDYINATNRLFINSAGNVGIGITVPLQRLHVNGGYIAVHRDASNVNNPALTYAEGSNLVKTGMYFGNSYATTNASWINFKTVTDANVEVDAMTIFKNGNIGIGTTTPTSKLQVVGLPVHASNAAAITAGLTAGAVYHTGDGIMRVVF